MIEEHINIGRYEKGAVLQVNIIQLKPPYEIFSKILLAATCLLLGSSLAFSQAYRSHHNMSSREYQQKFDEYTDQGYRIVQVDGYEVDGRAYFAAIWEKAHGPAFIAHHNMDAGDYQQKFDEYLKKGYRLVQVDGYGIGNRAY